MKKFTLLIAAFLFVFTAQAQFSITSNIGNIVDGTEFEASSTDEEDASVVYELHNESDSPINVRLFVNGFENTDGEQFELCLGGADQCYYKVIADMGYPIESYVTIQPGEVQPGAGFDHLWNRKEQGDVEGENITYDFQFQQLDPTGSVVIDGIDFTYIYAPTMGVEDFQKQFGVQIQSTLITDGRLNIEAQEPANVQIYNLLGQQVKAQKLTAGMNTVDVSNLTSQIYLVRFQNAKGETKTQKIILK